MLRIQTPDACQPEKAYAFHVLFAEMLGVPYTLEYVPTGKEHVFALPNGQKWLVPDNFPALFENHLGLVFPDEMAQNATFDPFSATFFMLSRWEEKRATTLDGHGRFPAAQSLAAQMQFLNRPVVNEWADEIWTQLQQMGWAGERKKRSFQVSFSCDVDHPRLWWSVADRLKTLAGALVKRMDFSEAGYWIKNHLFKAQDPYDVLAEWLVFLESQGIQAQFNFMGERPRNSDCWYPLKHPFIQRWMQKIAQNGHKIGFHASYEAFDKESVFQQELDSLRAVSPLPITSGRQHYLRFANPATWQMWESAGLLEDSTLGYPEAEGFRCGICHDFPVFDLEQRKMLRLREKPLILMDVTLAQYRAYTPEEASEQIRALRKTVQKYQGDFTVLWHNSSWNTPFWMPWKPVFRECIGEGTS